jgi:PBSX family phage terminase large subunit
MNYYYDNMTLDIDFNIKLTKKQKVANRIFSNKKHKRILLYGGAKSGKTFFILRVILYRAFKCPNSNHLILRNVFKDCNLSIIQPLNKLLKPFKDYYKYDKEKHIYEFCNGSIIEVKGVGYQEDRILGPGYSTIFFNEASEINFSTVEYYASRLSEKNILRKLMLFDCNPPNPRHWVHKVFKEKKNGYDNEPLKYPEMYASLLMNPIDNKENLAENYIEQNLETLSRKKRDRLLLGLFVNPEGMVFENFNDSCLKNYAELPSFEYIYAGSDTNGFNKASILVGQAGETVYLLSELYTSHKSAVEHNKLLMAKWEEFGYREGYGFTGFPSYANYCDPAGCENNEQFEFFQIANNSFQPGIDFIIDKIDTHNFYVVTENCPGFLGEVYEYIADSNGAIKNKSRFHGMDAVRYAVFSSDSSAPVSSVGYGRFRSKNRLQT